MSPRPVEGVTEEQRTLLLGALQPERYSDGTEFYNVSRGVREAIAALLSEVERLRAERERYEKALREVVDMTYHRGDHGQQGAPPCLACICAAALSASAPDTPTNEVPK